MQNALAWYCAYASEVQEVTVALHVFLPESVTVTHMTTGRAVGGKGT